MTRPARLLALALPLVLVAAPATGAPSAPRNDTEWISVHLALEGPCVLDTLDLAQPVGSPANVSRSTRQLDVLRQQHDLVSRQVEAIGGEVVASIKRLSNALQVRIPRERAPWLAEISDVVRVEPVPMYQRSLSSAVPFVGAPQAWETLAATGAGVKIGIADTGVDYLHADFGGSGDPAEYKANDRAIVEPGTFPTAKVVGGKDFVGDAYDGYSGIKPDADPLDCFEEESTAIAGGHGTHVAGIAAGVGVNLDGTPFTGSYLASLDPKTFRVFPGVAPEASLYALKIFGCDGGTNMVTAAIDWAVDPNDDGDLSDHLDVLNMSLGGSYGIQSKTEAEIVKNATLAGMLLVVAAGNDGDVFFVTGEPATYTEALSVAATVDEISYLAMKIDAPAAIAGDVPCAEGSFSFPLAMSGPITGKLVPTVPAIACGDLQNAADLAGHIAYIERGDCYFVDKVQRAADAGALAVVVVDNVEQDEPFSMGGDGSQKPIPAVMIRNADGAILTPHFSQGVFVTLDAENLYKADMPSDQMASFTSRGPRSLDGRLKPDVAAPGMAILSAGVGSGTDPRETSGTSMACPMAAGAAAVLRQMHPKLSPFDIKAMMMNTTAPMANPDGVPVPVSLGGAGRIRVNDAAAQTVTAAAASPQGAVSLSFGAIITTEPQTKTQELVVTNHGTEDRTFEASTVPTYPLEGASITISPSTLTVPAGGTASATVTLVIEPDRLPIEAPDPHTPATLIIRDEPYPRHFVTEFGGHVVLSREENSDLRVPFHAIVRAADRHEAGNAAMCVVGDDPPVSIPITGLGAHKEPVVSVFQHVLSHPVSVLPDSLPAEADIAEIGVAHDLASVGAFRDGTLYFAVAVAGTWTTPAKGPLSLFGIAIDTTGDFIEDYTVVAEPSSAFRFRDVLRSVTYRESNGSRAGRLDLNGVRRDELNTEPFFNSVVVFPVPLEGLAELTEESASFSFRVYTQQAMFPSILDRTDWVTYDPTHAPVDTARAGYLGKPLFGPSDPIRVFLQHDEIGEEAPPSLLLLHHSNEAGKRAQVVSLADVGAVYPSDLSVTQQAPVAMTAGATATWPVQVTHAQGGEARDVKLTVAVTDGAKVVSLVSDQGTCTAAGCTFAKLSVGETVTATVTVEAGGQHFEATAKVQEAADCDTNETNNTVTSGLEVAGGTGGTGGTGSLEGGVQADLSEFTAGGGCACRATTAGTASWWVGLLAAFGFGTLRQRRRNRRAESRTERE
jgi:MYXO-CTERM domain-containing protein